MAMKDTGVKIRFAFVRLRRKIALYFTLWFLALLTGVSLIVYVIFINPTVYSLKIWSVVLVVMLSVKLAYDLASAMKKEYADFARQNKDALNKSPSS
jgi:glucan phosphoethanolaminetransferase (alkaline phosphatase superfamily)